MMHFKLSRLFLVLFLLPIILGGCSRSTNKIASDTQLPTQSDGSTLINGYEVPAMANWQRETTLKSNDAIQSVKYSNTVEGTKIMMKFVIFPSPAELQPDTAKELAKSVQDADNLSKKMGENKQTLLSQSTQYHGHPAYLTKTSSRESDTLVESQILRVADGKNTFWFFQSLSGQQISPAARTAASVAWKDMTQNLKIP